MKFLDKKINDSYYQIYIILTAKEKKDILYEIKLALLNGKKEEVKEQINLYKNISKKSSSEMPKDKIKSLKQQLETMTVDNTEFEKDVLETGICQNIMKDVYKHIEDLKIIQVFDNECSLIGSLSDNNSLTIVYSFCYIPYDYKIIYPKNKGTAYFFTNKDIDMIQTEMMIANKMYTKVKVDKVSEFSDILFSYMFEDDMRFNLYMDISEIENKFNIDRSQLLDLDRNKYLVYNSSQQKCIINIKEIYDKKVFEINDDLVKKINFNNARTVAELRKQISNIFSFIYNVKSNVFSILQNIIDLNDFPINEYTKKHYFKQIGEEYINEIEEKHINDMKASFVTSYIFTKHDINIEQYFYYLEYEYYLLYDLKQNDVEQTLEEYYNMRAPYYALYEFFKQKNLVTERSNNE